MKKGHCKGKNHKILRLIALIALRVVGHAETPLDYGVGGAGLALPMSTTTFQEP